MIASLQSRSVIESGIKGFALSVDAEENQIQDNLLMTPHNSNPNCWAIGCAGRYKGNHNVRNNQTQKQTSSPESTSHDSSSVLDSFKISPSTVGNSSSYAVPSSISTNVPCMSNTPTSCPDNKNNSKINGMNSHIGSTSVPDDESIFQQSHYHDKIISQSSQAVDTILSAACETLGFDIAEMWLRTGPKTHQLTNTHLRPTAMDNSVRRELVEEYYGARSSERVHNLSPALCKRAKDAQDVVWVTSQTEHGAAALRCSNSDVRTAVAVPVCHEQSQTNMTVLYFSIRRTFTTPVAVEFLAHMSLAAANACVNSLSADLFREERNLPPPTIPKSVGARRHSTSSNATTENRPTNLSQSEHPLPLHHSILRKPRPSISCIPEPNAALYYKTPRVSVTGASLDLRWRNLDNVEYLTDGGNNWIHTAVLNRRSVVVKWLKPECQDLAVAINEIEAELDIHAKLQHDHIVELCGAGYTSKGSRFMVLERLDGGSLTQVLGYDTRIRDRRRRFWKKKHFTYVEVLKCARAIATAMDYLHSDAIPGSMVIHRDLKPDNIGFMLDGTVKIIDFGLARVVDDASPDCDDVYEMSGETGSLRYMAPEVADGRPYNHKADVYSYGIILWEMASYKKPFDGMDKEMFFEKVIYGGEKLPINKKWPVEFSNLMKSCWSFETEIRPNFRTIIAKIDEMLVTENVVTSKKKNVRKRITAMIDRHSTWF